MNDRDSLQAQTYGEFRRCDYDHKRFGVFDNVITQIQICCAIISNGKRLRKEKLYGFCARDVIQ